MASTNSTSKSSLNISTESDNLNLYTDQSTYVVTGNEQTKQFKGIKNDTYTVGQDENNKKEIDAKLLAYRDGIIRKGSELDHGEEDIDAKTRYTIYGQPDKWICDYEQLYQNCGVDSCLNVLSMAGVKDIHEATDEYNEWLNTPNVKTVKVNGEEQEIATYNKPLFTYETEQEFTLWAIQNSKNDQWLYRELYQHLNDDPSELDNNYWELRDKSADSYVLHSKNYSEYKKIEDIDKNKDGGTYDWMQVNILNHYGVDSKVYRTKDLTDRNGNIKEPASIIGKDGKDPRIMKLNNIKTYTNPITSETKTTIEGIDQGTIGKEIIKEIKTNDTGSVYEKTTTITTKRYVKMQLEGAEDPVWVENSLESTVTKETENYNEYTTVTEVTTISKSNPKPITKVEEVDKIEYQNSTENPTTTVKYKLNREKYTFAETLAQAVKDGKGVILHGNAYGLVGNKDEDYASHAITLVGVIEGNRVYKTVDENSFYANDIVGFYVIDTGGWLAKTEKAQFVSCQTLYNFMTNFAESKTTDEEYTDWSFVGTNDSIRNWADEMNLVGTNDKNVLVGNSANNKLYGKDGDDFLYGEGGNDSIYGENDSDFLSGGSGDDYIECGKGNDVVEFRASDVVKYVQSEVNPQEYIPVTTTQTDTVVANLGTNTLQFVNIDLNSLAISSRNDDLIIKYDQTYVASYKDEFIDLDGLTPKAIEERLQVSEAVATAIANTTHSWHKGWNQENGNTLLDKPATIIVKNYFKNGNSNTSSIQNIVEVTEAEYHVYYQKDENGDYKLDEEGKLIEDLSKRTSNPATVAHDFVKEFLNGRQIKSAASTELASVVTGSNYKDILTGGSYNDTIKGYGNNDVLYGAGGSDIIYTGSGDDTIYGSYGNDKFYCEDGTTVIKYEQNFEIDGTNYTGFGGNDYIYTGKGQDFIELTSVAYGNLKFAQSGNDLTILYNDATGDSITIQNYFKLKGKTSVKSIKLADTTFDLVNGYNTVSANLIQPENNSKNKGQFREASYFGDDKLYANNYGNNIDGKIGNDSIYGGKGNDTITGGLGNDYMTGGGGNDTYVFEDIANGFDTITPSANGVTILKFNDVDKKLNFNSLYGLDKGKANVTTLYDNVTPVSFAYTKSNNDLIINYSTSEDNTSTASVKIAGFYKSKAGFILEDQNGNRRDLTTDICSYMEAQDKEKAAKLTGSAYKDYIIGSNKNDKITALAENDVLIGGKGNDTLTGGAGSNIYVHNKGDGDDTIIFTKGENANIRMQGFDSVDDISFETSGSNLLITYTNDDLSKAKITLKNFYKTNVTADGSAVVNIYQEAAVEALATVNLKNDVILPKYIDFTAKKSKYTGTYLSDNIDANAFPGLKNNKGVTIDGGVGNDIIEGSSYNDTIKGGLGNDTIYAGSGVNTVDGGEDADTYKVFVHQGLSENTTINDTGIKPRDNNNQLIQDEVIVYGTTDIVIENEQEKTIYDANIWFNTDRYGNPIGGKPVYNIRSTANDAVATVTGVEKVTLNNNTENNAADDWYYNYNSVKEKIATFFVGKDYQDAASVMETYGDDKNTLLEYFQAGWQQQQP